VIDVGTTTRNRHGRGDTEEPRADHRKREEDPPESGSILDNQNSILRDLQAMLKNQKKILANQSKILAK
jgi:hypothetical protein